MQKSLYTAANRQLLTLLRTLREDAHLTQAQLGAKVGVDQSEVSNWERGVKRLDLVEICNIVDALDIPLREFIERFEKMAGRRAE